jgi:hypothetical protein
MTHFGLMTVIVLSLFLLTVILLYGRHESSRDDSERKGKTFVYLRVNNDVVRKSIRESGLKVCTCALNYTSSYLFVEQGKPYVCGFNEHNMHCIQKAHRDRMQVVDCGNDVEIFIKEVKAL